MQEGIIQMGRVLMKDSSILMNSIEELVTMKKGKTLHILKFMFDTSKDTFTVDANEEMDEDSVRKYMYIGSAPGANSPQWYSSCKSNIYILTETICNLCSRNLGEELNEKMKKILKEDYIDFGNEKFKSAKNRYALDLNKLGMDFGIKELYEDNAEKPLKELKDIIKKELLKSFETYLKENLGTGYDDIGLYTIFVDGEPLSDNEFYLKSLEDEKLGSQAKAKKGGKKENGRVCWFCGAKENLREDIQFDIKTYTTNQIIFSSGLDKKNYNKNMILCSDCFNAYKAGEKYMKNNLDVRLGRFSVYLYPHFIIGEPLSKEQLNSSAMKIKNRFTKLSNFKGVEDLRDFIDNELYDETSEDECVYTLNFMFYRQAQQATKILRLIKDVNPSVFSKMADSFEKACGIGYRHFKMSGEILNLKSIYYLYPIRLDKKGEATQFRNLLEVYSLILTQGRCQKEKVIKDLNESMKVIHFEESGFNISKNNPVYQIIKDNLYIKFLEGMKVIEGEEAMEADNLRIEDDMKSYIKDMGYTEEETGLFLLGALIGAVGNAEYKKNPDGKKAVLNKLNYAGMEKSKVIKLSNDIFNKLKQENILKYNESIFDEASRILSRQDGWKLNKDENLFYILAGYGYTTAKALANAKNSDKGERE